MPPILSENEVDALMDAVEDGRVDADSPDSASDSPAGSQVKPFDLTSRDRIVRGRMPTLDVINGRLARRFALELSNLIRMEVEVTAEPAAPMKLGEFLSYQSEPACINLVSLSPLLGAGLICIQPDLFFALLNTVFGGGSPQDDSKKEHPGNRGYTPIELDFARGLVGAWTAAAAASWSEIHPVKPAYLHTEVSPDHVAIGAASDVFMATTFQIQIGELEGKMEFAVGYASLEPIKQHLLEHHTEESAADRGLWQKRLYAALMTVPLRVQVELGATPTRLARLLQLKPTDVVRLDRHPASSLPMHLADHFKAWVAPLEQNGNLAFEFEDWRTHEH